MLEPASGAAKSSSSLSNSNDAERGIVRGVALNPGTPLEALDPLLDELEYISLLAVNPGWGGQKYIPATTARLARVQRMIEQYVTERSEPDNKCGRLKNSPHPGRASSRMAGRREFSTFAPLPYSNT